MASRRFLQDLPIRQKLRIIILIISSLSVAAACGLFVTYQWISSRALRAQRLEITADVVGSQAVTALEFVQPSEAATILKALKADARIQAAAIYGKDGTLFARYVSDKGDEGLIPAVPRTDGPHYESGHVLVFRPLWSEGARVGTICIRADLTDIRAILMTNIGVSVGLLGIATLVVLFLTGRLGRAITAPVQNLSEVVKSVSDRKDYSVRAEGGGRDELGLLITGFNAMLKEVEEREAALAKARDELEIRVKERTRDLELEVADRKAAQKQAQDKESKLSEAQQIAQMGSWEWDPAANKVEWSDELFRITGEMPNKFTGDFSKSTMVTHPDDRPGIVEALETCRDKREPFERDVRIIRPDGSIRYLRIHGKPVLDDKGKTLRVIGTAQDVTERKRADQAIEKLNDELRSRVDEVAAANKELEGFSYSVSHDLRAPLRAIHGYSQMLREDYADKVDGEGRRYLDVISTNTRRMGQLIDDLLDFSRLGRKALNAAPVDMDVLVKQVIEEATAAAPDRKLEFRVGSLPPAHGDISMLRIVLNNLVSNAIKYSKGRDPAVIELGGRSENGMNTYFIKDNGVGFEMEYAHKLFGVFQRLHRSEDFEGTGVGLALVQRIIHKHGGKVSGQGRVNQGATFTFTLPGSSEGRGGAMINSRGSQAP